MVSNEEINRRLEARIKGIKPKNTSEMDSKVIKNGQICPSCETESPSTAKYCVGCGEKLENKPHKLLQEAVKTEKPIKIETPKEFKITPRPDDFGRTGQPDTKSLNKIPETTFKTANKYSEVDPVERIKKAKELLDMGAITQEEFDNIKKKYIDEI